MVFRIFAISFLASIAGAQPKPASDAPVYRFHYVSIMDDPAHIGGEAYHILAPADWHVTGGVIWKADPALPALAWARLFGSGGREIGALPSNAFVWNPQMFGRNFPPGSTYAGSEVQPPALDPLQCIERVVIPRYRHNLAGARIVKQEPLPELAQAGRLKYPGPEYRNAMFQAGKVRFEYVENGVEMEEDVYVLTSAVQFRVGPTTSTVWAADEVRYSRAPKGVLDSQVPLFETAMFSMKPNLLWWAKMEKVAQMLAQQQIQASNAAVERARQQQEAADRLAAASRAVARSGDQINDMIMKGYQNRMATMDKINQRWDRTIRGVELYRDPSTGQTLELPSHDGTTWGNGLGDYLQGGHNFDPNAGPSGRWQQLQKVEP